MKYESLEKYYIAKMQDMYDRELGNKYGKLTVIHTDNLVKGKVLCHCECGKEKYIATKTLKNGQSKSCGCSRLANQMKTKGYTDYVQSDITGMVFDKLTAVRPSEKRYGACAIWECICECGEYVYLTKSALTNRETHMCAKCRKELEKPISRKQRNIRKLRRTKEYIANRIAVLERDNYTCAKCGNNGERMEIHHVIPMSEDFNKANDIDNCVTLCRECHIKKDIGFHSLYGTKNFTENNFKEFMKGATA